MPLSRIILNDILLVWLVFDISYQNDISNENEKKQNGVLSVLPFFLVLNDTKQSMSIAELPCRYFLQKLSSFPRRKQFHLFSCIDTSLFKAFPYMYSILRYALFDHHCLSLTVI